MRVAALEGALDSIEGVLCINIGASEIPPLMAIGSSLIATLTTIGVYCPTSRERVKALLRKCPRVEALWDAAVAETVIAHLTEVEVQTGEPSLRIQVEQQGLDKFTVIIQQPSGLITDSLRVGHYN